MPQEEHGPTLQPGRLLSCHARKDDGEAVPGKEGVGRGGIVTNVGGQGKQDLRAGLVQGGHEGGRGGGQRSETHGGQKKKPRRLAPMASPRHRLKT